MASEVLQKTRRINKTLQTSSGSKVSFDKLAETLGEVLDANVYVLNTKGKVLGLYLTDIQDSSVIIDEDTKQKRFSIEYNESLLKISETLENLTGDELVRLFPEEHVRSEKYLTTVPILGSGQRLGSLVLARYKKAFNDDDLVISEYSATVIGMEILKSLSEEMEVEMRKKDFNISIPITVNALRKFESAGVIESRSLGMKGTHIKILNDKLIPELKKVRNNY